MYTIESTVVSAYRTNCYALRSDAGTLVIDPGDEPARLLRWLDGHTVLGIVLTHCHSDHIGAVNEIVEATGAWVACGRNDIPGTRDLHLSGFDAEGIDYRVNHVDRALEATTPCASSTPRDTLVDTSASWTRRTIGYSAETCSLREPSVAPTTPVGTWTPWRAHAVAWHSSPRNWTSCPVMGRQPSWHVSR